LSVLYGWTPQQINRLTLFQVTMYMGGPVPGLGKQRMSLEEGLALREMMRGMGRR
jgi:hypothetical protein